jgi:glycosyltransferase involved in cell wall biosynthesis
LGVLSDKICLVRNGSDPSILPEEKGTARQALSLPPHAPLIGFIGGIYSQDAHFMAQAFNFILERLPEARLLLIGYFNRPLEPMLAKPEAVIRSGPVAIDQMYRYLSACDLGWLPLTDSGANRGRWPYKLNDYITAGKPVVSTAVGDLPQVIQTYHLGLAAPVDPLEFSKVTLSLLADASLRDELGHTARQAAEGPLSWEAVTSDLEGFYHHMLETNSHSL